MRAALAHGYGDPDVLRVEETADPTPKRGQVLVEVHAAGVNPIDYKMRRGYYRVFLRYRMPWIFGLDVSGVVRAVGPGVTDFKEGDEVYASPGHQLPGAYAELSCVRQEELCPKPASLSHVEAASLPLVFQTAWQCLVDIGKLKSGEHCFIQAGSGGVGTVAIQIAKARGARVTTTCSARNIDFVKELGADEVVDYTKDAFDDVVKDVDVCLDCLGFDAMHRAIPMMARGGRIVGISPNLPERVGQWGPVLGFISVGGSIAWVIAKSTMSGVKTRFHTRVARRATQLHCNELVEAGQIRPQIDRVFSLDEIVEAHRYLETGRARGKVVIKVR